MQETDTKQSVGLRMWEKKEKYQKIWPACIRNFNESPNWYANDSQWTTGVVVRASDSWSTGCEFDSRLCSTLRSWLVNQQVRTPEDNKPWGSSENRRRMIKCSKTSNGRSNYAWLQVRYGRVRRYNTVDVMQPMSGLNMKTRQPVYLRDLLHYHQPSWTNSHSEILQSTTTVPVSSKDQFPIQGI